MVDAITSVHFAEETIFNSYVSVPACVRKNVNYGGNTIRGKATRQRNWFRCSQECDKEPACQAFSFVTHNYYDDIFHDALRGVCRLKDKNFRKKVLNSKGIFSAPRGCGMSIHVRKTHGVIDIDSKSQFQDIFPHRQINKSYTTSS